MRRDVNLALAAYPGLGVIEALRRAHEAPVSEPYLGELSLAEIQICPQNRGVVDVALATDLRAAHPTRRFRLHANARTLPTRHYLDLAQWHEQAAYWRSLAEVSRALAASAYTAHAGRRAHGTLSEVFDAARAATQLFGCRVGVEGLYPTPTNMWLLSTWTEYAQLLESGVDFALDLSHLHIVATQSGRHERALVRELLASPACLEVHVSGNDGRRDAHQPLDTAPWWLELLDAAHPDAVVFSEAVRARPTTTH